jgi:hypothetical protein
MKMDDAGVSQRQTRKLNLSSPKANILNKAEIDVLNKFLFEPVPS